MITPDFLDQTASVHRFLRNVTWDTLKDSINQILDSDLVRSPTGIHQIASGILAAVNSRPLHIPALAQFAKSLCESISHYDLRSSLFKMMRRSFLYSKPVPTEAGSFAFLFHGFQTGLFSWATILRLSRFASRQTCLTRTTCWLLCYFAPELDASDPHLTRDMTQILRRNHTFPQIFRALSDNLDHWSADHWAHLKQQRDFFTSAAPSVLSHLQHDDVSSLALASQHPSFTIDSRIPPTPFLPSRALYSHPTLLQAAAFLGSVRCFKWLLANGADLRARDRSHATVPQLAVASGNVELIRVCQQYHLPFHGTLHASIHHQRDSVFDWLSQSADAAEVDSCGNTPLHCACESNNLHALPLLARAADVNTPSQHWRSTPLRLAVRRGHASAVRFLLRDPAVDVEARDARGLTALAVAAKHGDVDLVRALLRAGADPNDSFETAPLIIAAHRRQLGVVAHLLTVPSIALNVANRDGVTALILAARAGWDDLARLLVGDARADVNARAADGSTALLWAIRRGSDALFRAIIARRDVDLAARARGGTLLHAAVKRPQMVAQLLARRAIDVDAVDAAGETALHRAAWVGGLDVAAMLIAGGADVNAALERSGTALHFAIAQRHADVAKALIAVPRMDVNWRSGRCSPAINLAIAGGMADVVAALCARGDIELGGEFARTSLLPPLVVAAHAGNVVVLRSLLGCARMRIGEEACGGKVACEIAMRKGFGEFGEMLRDAMKSKGVEKKGKRFGFGWFRRLRRSKKASRVV